ncbi:MAG TPA: alpha/beta fold hydrolase [Solirubrobacteraceae bacterium]|nr:alpha/beta fold hydrolase [Solirubrobacteraceae bacterium]
MESGSARPRDDDLDSYGSVGRSAWMDVDWSAHQRWLEVEDQWVNIVEIGSGPPLLLIHGLSCWQSWLENICAFASDHRVIAIDLPGFGRSPSPSDPASIPGYARLVDAVCEALDVERAIVAGNSMGGFIGAELAIRFPGRVERLCVAPAIGLDMEHVRVERRKNLRSRLENVLFFVLALLASRSDFPVRRARLRRHLLALIVAHPELLSGALILEVVRGTARPTGFTPALDAMTRYPIRDRLGEIVCPTLIIWGEEDRLVPVTDASEFEWLIPDSRKLIYPDTGHLPMLERPARFNADLRAFIAEASPQLPPRGRRRRIASAPRT